MEARNSYGRLTLGMSGSFGTDDSHPGFGGTSANPVSLFRRNETPSRFLDNLRPEGYDECFDPPLENKYECPICLLGLREPVQTICGHRFCRGCILRSIRDAGPKCPVDNVHLDEWQLHPDNFAKREMLNHPVFCRLKKQYECPWKGPLSKLEDHLEECDFVDVSCPKNCGKEFQRKDLEKHLEVDCPNRTILCSFCAEEVLGNSMEGLPPAQSEDHATTFVALDLSSQASKHRTRDALWMRQKLHSNLVALTQQQQVNMDELATLVQTILRVVEQLKPNESNVRVETLCQQQQTEIDGLRDLVIKMRGDEERLERRLNESLLRVETSLQELTIRFNHQEMRVLGFEGSLCNGSYMWRIENYRQRRQDAINGIEKAIYSPAFYIRVDGYKLCLSIYLNGVNSGVEECIDILVHVMLGVNDSKLVWPLTGVLTLGIFDQSVGTESPQHISHSLNTDPNQLAFQRPTGPRNVGYRCIRIPISGILEHLHIKNDSILVGIEMAG